MAPKVYLRLRCLRRSRSRSRRRHRRRRRCCKHDAHICIYDLLVRLLHGSLAWPRLPPSLLPLLLLPLPLPLPLADLVNYATARSVTRLILRPFLRALLAWVAPVFDFCCSSSSFPTPLFLLLLLLYLLLFLLLLRVSIGKRKLENALNSCGLQLRLRPRLRLQLIADRAAWHAACGCLRLLYLLTCSNNNN